MEIKRADLINFINKIYRQEQVRKVISDETAANSPKDSLEISAFSEVLKKEIDRPGKADPSRAEKIVELSRKIEAGEYKVDCQELADIMLSAKKGEQ